MQRENPAVHGGRESRQHRQLFAPAGRSHTQPRRHDRPHVGTIGQSRDSDPTLAGYPLRERRGYRHKTTRYLRIPHGIGVTGAWHSLHSSVCERKFPTLPPSGGVGSRAVYRAEDVTCSTDESSSTATSRWGANSGRRVRPKAGWDGPSAVDAFVDGSGPRGAPVVPSRFHHLRVGIERLRRVGRDLVSIERNSATR